MNPNDAALSSWLEIPSNSDFPIQNLPFGIFKKNTSSPRAGVAIGDLVLDLAQLYEADLFDGLGIAGNVFAHDSLNTFIGLGKETTRKVRNRVSQLLRSENEELKNSSLVDSALIPQNKVEMLLPIEVRNYTDFYSSEQHAFNVGSMFRDPDNALLPNWKHIPVGYHGRASSIVVSGTPIHRPKGQTKKPDETFPKFGPTRLLDFELEMAFITCKENGLGNTIQTSEADDYIFGFVLFNDWSARDIQAWEYVPLGPFLAKNFASSVSPWVVTMDALEAFRTNGPKQDPPVLPYLEYQGKCHFDINLEVLIQPEGAQPTSVTRSNFKHMYWNVNQQLAHHAINGCNIQVGDIYASGTISGNEPSSYGSMLELTWRGSKPISLEGGLERKFIEDNDKVIMRGHASNGEVRIGFGEVSNMILPPIN